MAGAAGGVEAFGFFGFGLSYLPVTPVPFGAIPDLADLATECFALLAGAAREEVKLMIASGFFPAIFEGTKGK